MKSCLETAQEPPTRGRSSSAAARPPRSFLRRGRAGARDAIIGDLFEPRLRAARRRVPQDPAPERDQHRRAEILPWLARLAGARELCQADDLAVAGMIAGWGREGAYFATDDDADAVEAELTHILLDQEAAFNSLVWFNVSASRRPTVLRLLHLQRPGHDGVDPRLEHEGGHDLPRWLRLGHQPLQHLFLSHEHLSKGRLWPSAPSASCAVPTRGPGRSSPAARPAARRRWSSSTSTIPTFRTSSVQGQRGGEGRRPSRCWFRHADRRRRLHVDPVPERQQLGRVTNDYMQAVEASSDWEVDGRVQR